MEPEINLSTDNSKFTILIVDDNESVVASLSAVLQRQGYVVNFAANGRDALIAVSKSEPTLIILDTEMPIMDGFETIKELKAHKKIANVPVIFHISTTKPEIIKKVFELGASDYITKPFIAEELLARVNKEIKQIALQTILKEKISKLANILTHDPLTRISNKMHMLSIINSKLKELDSKQKSSFSLLYIDIDNFDTFAKTNGMVESENALKKIASVLKHSIKNSDTVSHWEGDKFMIMLPDTTNEEFAKITGEINSNLAKTSFPSFSLTCSMVIMEIYKRDTIQNILKILLKKMQEAKNIHKNSIITGNGRLLL